MSDAKNHWYADIPATDGASHTVTLWTGSRGKEWTWEIWLAGGTDTDNPDFVGTEATRELAEEAALGCAVERGIL